MTTISSHEYIASVSLRTCGSSIGPLLQKRRQLKSPDKPVHQKAHNKARIPNLCGVSISPHKQLDLGLGDTDGDSLTVNSPIPRWQHEGFCTTPSSDEFSNEDINELCCGTADSCAPETHDRLLIVGTKQLISCKYDTPKHLPCDCKARYSLTFYQSDDGGKSVDMDNEMVRGCTSPENPPPSPINIRPSLDEDVVGERHISCPERTKSTADTQMPLSQCDCKARYSLTFHQSDDGGKSVEMDNEMVRGCTSPENPPPCPINFRPSLDEVVVGERHISCPERTKSTADTQIPLSCDFKARYSLTFHQSDDGGKSVDMDSEMVRGCTSPENPPPSPINFRPSLDEVGVGERHISCPERTKSTADTQIPLSCRDFNPGFVKQPLYYCDTCAEKVVEQEKSQNVLLRRTYVNSRASPYRHSECQIGIKSSLASPTSTYVCNADHAHWSSEDYMRTFVELISEKKRQKVERDETQNLKKQERKKEEAMKMLERSKRIEEKRSEIREKKSRKQAASNRLRATHATTYSHKTIADDTAITLNDTTDGDSRKSRIQTMCRVGDMSVANTVQGDETMKTCSPERPTMHSISSCHMLEKCQVRSCWSDIWPLPDGDTAVVRRTDETEDVLSNDTTPAKNKSRITPFSPMPLSNNTEHTVKQAFTSKSIESMTPLTGNQVVSSTDGNAELVTAKEDEIESTESKQPTSITDTNHSSYVNSRASPYRHSECQIGIKSSLATPTYHADHAHSSSEDYMRTFVEVFSEKKRQKVERDKKHNLKKQERKKQEAMKILERSKRIEEKKSEIREKKSHKQAEFSFGSGVRVCDPNRLRATHATTYSNKTIADDTANTLNDTTDGDSRESRIQTLCRVGDKSVANTVQGDETVKTCSPLRRTMHSISSCHMLEKCQDRQCWSDIWPLPDGDTAVVRGTDETEDVLSNDTTPAKNESRMTPFFSMPLSNNAEHTVKQPTNITDTNTMAVTLLVPPARRSCTQWVSFNADQEPVLNNSPPVDANCDTFLKRIQRTKSYASSDTPVPTGNQFCFEAMVDKRYNRWKRRRRNRKETQYHRSRAPHSSDSSDDDEIGERRSAMELIIDHMYEEMHGMPPETPNGSRDTPRMRNSRRRREHADDTENTKSSTNKQGETSSTADHYDASSEWTSSDKDPSQLSSNSGVGIGRLDIKPASYSDLTNRKRPDTPAVHIASLTDTLATADDTLVRSQSPSKVDDLCRWPFMEHYKVEIIKRIQATSPDQLDELSQRDWLPKIPSRPASRSEQQDTRSFDSCTKRSTSPLDEGVDIQLLQSRHSSSASAATGNDETTPTDRPVIKVRIDSSKGKQLYQKWSRKRAVGQGTSSKPREDTDRQLIKPIKPKSIGMISVGGISESSVPGLSSTTFKAALQPIRSTETTDKLRQLTGAKSTKKTYVDLTLVNKTARKQTTSARVDQALRKKNKVQSSTTVPGLRGKHVAFENQSSPDLVFRKIYLRSSYGRKVRMNSHINSDSREALRGSITVGKLDIGSRKPAKQPIKSEKTSKLSMTRAITFSLLDLPEVYKMNNRTILQRAHGELSAEESAD